MPRQTHGLLEARPLQQYNALRQIFLIHDVRKRLRFRGLFPSMPLARVYLGCPSLGLVICGDVLRCPDPRVRAACRWNAPCPKLPDRYFLKKDAGRPEAAAVKASPALYSRARRGRFGERRASWITRVNGLCVRRTACVYMLHIPPNMLRMGLAMAGGCMDSKTVIPGQCPRIT